MRRIGWIAACVVVAAVSACEDADAGITTNGTLYGLHVAMAAVVAGAAAVLGGFLVGWAARGREVRSRQEMIERILGRLSEDGMSTSELLDLVADDTDDAGDSTEWRPGAGGLPS